MSTESMALALDGRHRPIEIGARRWSSSKGGWAGFPVECHVLGPRGKLNEFGIDHALLGLCIGGAGVLQIDQGKSRQRVQSVPGKFTILGSGFEQRPLAWTGTREMLYVGLGSDRLEQLMSHDPAAARLSLEPQYAISDPQVVSLVLNMRDEIRAGCPAGRLYGEALSLALAAYLFGRYSRRRAPPTPGSIVLSARQVRRVRDYVCQNLGSDIGLSELADQTGLSPHYFSLLFRRAFGVPPYRYVLSARIDRARQLLSERGMSISEIALELGFADQSHFSRVFKSFARVTPRQYRSLS